VITRRKLLGMLAAGAIAAPGLLVPRKTIFLPPLGGWPQIPIASFMIPKWSIGEYAEGLAKGHFLYDESTETMSLLKHDPERAQIDGKFHSPSGRIYDWEVVADGAGGRAAIDDELDKPQQDMELAAVVRAEHLALNADPVMNLPRISDVDKITWESFPTSAQERRVMDILRDDAIAKGLPVIPDTYCLDANRLLESDYYKKFAERRRNLDKLSKRSWA
jgi:hypothetical protein